MNPDTAPEGLDLSESDKIALKSMRHDIWYGGMVGLAGGFVTGVLGFEIVKRLSFVQQRFQLLPKHAFATPLFTGAIGSLIGSLSNSRNHAHTVHYIIHKNSKVQGSDYQSIRSDAMKRDDCEDDGINWGQYRALRSKESNSNTAPCAPEHHHHHHAEWAEVIRQERSH